MWGEVRQPYQAAIMGDVDRMDVVGSARVAAEVVFMIAPMLATEAALAPQEHPPEK